MKRVITLSVFITLVLIVMLAKTSHAQRRISAMNVYISAYTPVKVWTPGFWKWSPSLHRYVWVSGYWSVKHPRKRVYVHVR